MLTKKHKFKHLQPQDIWQLILLMKTTWCGMKAPEQLVNRPRGGSVSIARPVTAPWLGAQSSFCPPNITPASACDPRHDTYYRAQQLHCQAPGMQVRETNKHAAQSTPGILSHRSWAWGSVWNINTRFIIFLYIFTCINIFQTLNNLTDAKPAPASMQNEPVSWFRGALRQSHDKLCWL